MCDSRPFFFGRDGENGCISEEKIKERSQKEELSEKENLVLDASPEHYCVVDPLLDNVYDCILHGKGI